MLQATLGRKACGGSISAGSASNEKWLVMDKFVDSSNSELKEIPKQELAVTSSGFCVVDPGDVQNFASLCTQKGT